MPPNHLILCCPLLLPSVFPSIRLGSYSICLGVLNGHEACMHAGPTCDFLDLSIQGGTLTTQSWGYAPQEPC